MDVPPHPEQRLTRRRLLAGGIGSLGMLAAGGAGLFELVDHGVLPGKRYLDEIDGACNAAPGPAEHFAKRGPTLTGGFHSRARNREVAYTLAYPPGHGPGSRLPLIIYMYGNGGDHNSSIGGLALATALAGITAAGPLPPMAMVCADGGRSLYWNPHPGDDPQAMLIHELIPRLQRLGLGTAPGGIGTTGISMGGYGALLLAEKFPDVIAATAAISPAIFTTYAAAVAVNPASYSSPSAFAAADVVTHAGALRGKPVRVASGNGDPFHPGVMALARALGPGAEVVLGGGCHDNRFFAPQRHVSLAFLGRHLTRG